MRYLQDIVPTLPVLKSRIHTVFASDITDFLARTRERRMVVLKNRRYLVLSISTLLISFLALFLVYGYLTGFFMTVAVMFLLGVSVSVLLFSHHWYREQKILTKELNLALIPTITACFERLVLYTADDVHHRETEAMVRDSGILPEEYDSFDADDMYTFYEPYTISAREIYVSKMRGKNQHATKVFHGLFVIVELPKVREGVTAISSEGDTFGLRHKNFWGESLLAKGLAETTLEWNQFERDIHVATTNPVEAREILTPDCMMALHAWWVEYGQNIRLVFKDARLFILLPDNGIKIGTSTTSTEAKELEAYALSVLKPLWYVLRVIERVG